MISERAAPTFRKQASIRSGARKVTLTDGFVLAAFGRRLGRLLANRLGEGLDSCSSWEAQIRPAAYRARETSYVLTSRH